jgi:serine/threonine-protein kinase
MTKSPSTGPPGPPKEAVQTQLEKILGSEEFSQSESLKRFLQYVVERSLDGEADQIKEYNVAVEVLGRGEDYDPRTDTIVRVQATRLRSKLNEYYRTEGSGDPLRIEIPKGSYVPTFKETGGDTSGSSTPGLPRSLGILLSVAAIVVLALAAFWISGSRDPDTVGTPGAIHSIAVLPFTDMSQLKDQEFFGDGIAEELTNTLTQLEGLYIAPRTSAFQFKGQSLDIRDIGERLGVDHVVQGSVRKSGDDLRVTAQLIRAADGTNLWSETYDRREEEVFAVQEEISRSIANALQVKLLASSEQYWTDHYMANADLYELYLRGRYHLNAGTELDINRAVDLFEDVLAQDPDYAPAYAGLVDSYASLAYWGFVPPPELEEEARKAADKALELDGNLVDAQLAIAAYEILFRWDWSQGELAVRRALQLEPASARAHQWYGRLLTVRGRLEEALSEARRARELDQLSLSSAVMVPIVLYLQRDYEAAVSECEKILQWAPESNITRVVLGLAFRQQSRYEDALATFKRLERLSGTSALALSLMAQTFATAGNIEEAQETFDELKGLAELKYVAPSYVAKIYLGLGEKEAALDWLESAYENRSLPITSLKTDPDWDALRSDPRFTRLLQKVGL